MVWPFAARLPIDADELEFQLATFKWLIAEFGPAGARGLIVPTADYFPLSGATGEDGVREVFDHVRAAAGMANWPCELRAGARDRPIDAGNSYLLRHEGKPAPCGTFHVEAGAAGRHGIITYNPGMARDQAGLVATFAHELGHYLMATAATAPPGGWELHELHTDLIAVYLGFGTFMANHARSFGHFSTGSGAGWQASWRGYLSEGALVTATAIVERLAGRDPLAAAPWLKPYLQSDLKRTVRALARRAPDMAVAVEAVDLGDYAAE